MIVPVRCMSCGKPIGHLWDEFREKTLSRSAAQVLDDLGVERYCCRAQLLGHVDLIDVASKFKRY